ncbi:AraC family transcriptional regulator [Rhodobacteraceae bacterium WD3A24]|nr:AraC family transcriptional regulator [Rhodobacteraceae bacterium WD3A24]
MTQIPEPPPSLRLTPIPRLAAGGRWRVEAMRSLREPLMLWFTQGQGRITVAGNTRGFGTHNAVFIPPGTMHAFEMKPRVQGTAVFFGRDHGLDLPDEPRHLRVREAVAQKELVAVLDNIQRELESDRPASDRAARYHLGLLGVWLERQLASEERAPSSGLRESAARRLTARYTGLLERDFSSGMGVGDYAAALGVTPTHLTRACKAACGRAAHELLQDRVLYEARRLLSETRTPVKEVARQLGFSSPAYFTRAFQKRTGQTPSGFRRASGPAAPGS